MNSNFDDNQEEIIEDNEELNNESSMDNVADKAQEVMKDAKAVANVAKAVTTGDVSGLMNVDTWKRLFKIILKIAIIGLVIILIVAMIISLLIMVFGNAVNSFFGLGIGRSAKWSYLFSGTNSTVTKEIVDEIRENLETQGVNFNNIGYIGEEIFDEVGLNLNSDGTYEISKSKYMGTDANGNKTNTKVNSDLAMNLYIQKYLEAQSYTINKYNRWTFSNDKGAIKVTNYGDSFTQVAVQKDPVTGQLYANTKIGKKIYIEDEVDNFGMLWQFPYAFHQATLCPDLGSKIADLAKDYHELELWIKEVKYEGKRLKMVTTDESGIETEQWENFLEKDYVVLIKKKSTWFASEIYDFEEVKTEINTDTEKSIQTSWVVSGVTRDDTNREALKALIAEDAEYYRSNELSKKDSLKFETSAQIVIDMMKRVYFDVDNTQSTTDYQMNEPIRNLMYTFYEMGYLNSEDLNEGLMLNYEDYVTYKSPLSTGLPEGWPRAQEQFNNGVVKFAGNENTPVVSIVNGKILEVGDNYVVLSEDGTGFTIKYMNFNVSNSLIANTSVSTSTILGTLGLDALTIQVINDSQETIDPTSLFMVEGIEGAGGYIYFNQGSDPWGPMMYSTVNDRTQTYKSSACGPSSLAIVIANVKNDSSITPLVVGSKILNTQKYRRFRLASNGTTAEIFTNREFLAEFGMSPGQYLGANSSAAVNAVSNGYIVAIIQTHMNKSGSTSGHYLVFAPPKNGQTGLIQVLDPGSRKITGIKSYSQFVADRNMINFRGAWAFEL